MAQSLRRPLSQIAGISSSLQCRQFSHISSRWAKVEMSAPTQRQRQKSLQVMQKEFLAAGKLPSDMGLLESMLPSSLPSVPVSSKDNVESLTDKINRDLRSTNPNSLLPLQNPFQISPIPMDPPTLRPRQLYVPRLRQDPKSPRR
jgi:hypothetical protein